MVGVFEAVWDHYRRNDWQAYRKYGGGQLNNAGAHYVDLLLHLAGGCTRWVWCAMRTVAALRDAEDVVKAAIETEEGVILDLDINIAAAQPIVPWQVLGARGSVVLDRETEAWRVRYFRVGVLGEGTADEKLAAGGRRCGNVERIPWEERVVSVADYAPVDYYERCYGYFALGEVLWVPIEEAREETRVLDLCWRSGGVE